MASKINQVVRRKRLGELQDKLRSRTDGAGKSIPCYAESNEAIKAEISRLETVIANEEARKATASSHNEVGSGDE